MVDIKLLEDAFNALGPKTDKLAPLTLIVSDFYPQLKRLRKLGYTIAELGDVMRSNGVKISNTRLRDLIKAHAKNE